MTVVEEVGYMKVALLLTYSAAFLRNNLGDSPIDYHPPRISLTFPILQVSLTLFMAVGTFTFCLPEIEEVGLKLIDQNINEKCHDLIF